MPNNPALILASASPRRKDLLAQIGVVPDEICPAELDETPHAQELPRPYACRLAEEKARAVRSRFATGLILAADTVVACGRRILPKTEEESEARQCLELMSGRAHKVMTAIAVMNEDDDLRVRLVETRVKLKRLTPNEIDEYIASGEWRGKAGGYGVQGRAGAFVAQLSGSYTAVVGLPIYETRNLLQSFGYVIPMGEGKR